MYSKLLKEAEFTLDPDSREAYYEKDPGNENEDVIVLDEIEGKKVVFSWNRKKSNENIFDTDDGKEEFTFYLARHVFKDHFSLTTSDMSPNAKLENDLEIGIIPGDKQEMVVVNVNSENWDKIRIISAYYIDGNNRLAKEYWKNRKKRELLESHTIKQESIEEIEKRRRLIEEWRKNRKFIRKV
jgi:uncharacterized DUF497 family protein